MAPFWRHKEEYKYYLETNFILKEMSDAYNSIPPRFGNELFVIFEKRHIKNWFSLADCAYFAIAKKPGILRFQ